MNIFGLHITRASKLKKEQRDLVTAVRKQNALWNRVISKLLYENHQMRLAK